MAIFEIYLPSLDQEFANIANNFLNIITVLVVFHFLCSQTYKSFPMGVFSSPFLNDDFLQFLIFVLLGFFAYSMVVRKIILFKS